jgi:hypothetical protein
MSMRANTEFRLYSESGPPVGIPYSEFRIQNTEFRIQNPDQNSEYRTLNTELRTEYGVLNTEAVVKKMPESEGTARA